MNSFTLFTWTLTAITIFATYLNCTQRKMGFLLWGLCNIAWIFVDFSQGILAQSALYFTHLGFNVYGWKQWTKKEKAELKADVH